MSAARAWLALELLALAAAVAAGLVECAPLRAVFVAVLVAATFGATAAATRAAGGAE